MWLYVVAQVCTNGDRFRFYIATLYRQILAHDRPARRISLPASLPLCSQTLTLAKNSSKSPLPHTGNVVLVSPGMAVQWLGVLICATRIVFFMQWEIAVPASKTSISKIHCPCWLRPIASSHNYATSHEKVFALGILRPNSICQVG